MKIAMVFQVILLWMILLVPFAFSSEAPAPPEARLKTICGQCHALRIDRDCVAGQCGSAETKTARNKNWPQMIGWIRSLLGCKMEDADQEVLSRYLTQRYPVSIPTNLWQEVGTIPQGWNVVSLLRHGRFLYAGTEGKGKIFRSPDGQVWQEVADTRQLGVYGVTSFHDRLFIGTDDPKAEIWSSENGADWKRVAALPTDQTGIISLGIFKEELYAGTAEGKVFRSPDGVDWKKVGDLEEGPHWVRFLVPFKDRLYAGTQHGRLFRSSNGTDWEEVGGPMRQGRKESSLRGVAVFREALYVGTLLGGEIWRSQNGLDWENVYRSSSGPDRGYLASMLPFDDYLYAGTSEGFGYGVVLRSRDGVQWENTGVISPHTIEALAPFENHLYAATLVPPQAKVFRFESH